MLSVHRQRLKYNSTEPSNSYLVAARRILFHHPSIIRRWEARDQKVVSLNKSLRKWSWRFASKNKLFDASDCRKYKEEEGGWCSKASREGYRRTFGSNLEWVEGVQQEVVLG
ncbi:hypothetical protein CK203_082687 [Vitis vinifera]|uniref:Uncharacterized protein n=1 Tax=Vitis vinifera TaxID=29760 RepID=A0A438BWJ1_VITVI|nr:hypothetical protein CK203_082687 [Vitis vinifera]